MTRSDADRDERLDWLAPRRVRDDVQRLHGKMGMRALARRVGIGWRRLKHLLEAMGLSPVRRWSWVTHRTDLAPEGHRGGTYSADDYIRERLGEQGWSRTAAAIGVTRVALRERVRSLGLRMSDLRTDLTAPAVARLIGWSERWVRRHLSGRNIDGVWRIWPSELREWIIEDVRRVRWERVATEDVLETVSLIVGDWGVGDDAVKEGRAAPVLRPARQRRAQGDA